MVALFLDELSDLLRRALGSHRQADYLTDLALQSRQLRHLKPLLGRLPKHGLPDYPLRETARTARARRAVARGERRPAGSSTTNAVVPGSVAFDQPVAVPG